MHARSASLDFQAHLQYEKIRNSAIHGSVAAAAMERCGQEVVSRNHDKHQQMIHQHQLQQSGSFVSGSAPHSPPRHSNPAHVADSEESCHGDVDDDDERLLQQALGKTIFVMFGCSPFSIFCVHFMSAELSRLAFEEMRSQAQQEEDDMETAIRLSILEAEEQSKLLLKEQHDASASPPHCDVSASPADSWQVELEAARQREQQARFSSLLISRQVFHLPFFVQALLSFAMAQQQAVAKMDIVQESFASLPSPSAITSSVASTSLPASQPLPDLSSRSSVLPRLGALPPISRGSRQVLDNSALSMPMDHARSSPPPTSSSEVSGAGFGSKMDPLELHKRKQHLESLRDQIRLREQQERRQALADTAVAPSSAPLSEAQLQQRRELAERLKSL